MNHKDARRTAGTGTCSVQDQRQELHRIIHGEGYGYQEIEELIKEIFAK